MFFVARSPRVSPSGGTPDQLLLACSGIMLLCAVVAIVYAVTMMRRARRAEDQQRQGRLSEARQGVFISLMFVLTAGVFWLMSLTV